MRARLIAFVTAGMLVVLAPSVVTAHERWFVDSTPHPTQLERLWSLPVLLALVGGTAAIAALLALRHITGGDNLFPRFGFLRRFDPAAPVVIAIQTAIALIYMAVNVLLLAPNLQMTGVVGYVLAAAQIFVAFTFISGAFTRIGAGVLVALVLVCGVLFGIEAMLEQSIYVGIGLYILIQGRGLIDPEEPNPPQPPALQRYSAYAPSIVRIMAGVSITTLAFTEKLLNPALGVAFLREYPHFNVAQLIGITWFADERFIFAAGIVEFVVGVALISGILPRLVIIGMFVPFNLTIPFLPPSELLGHLPIFAVMYVLVFHVPSNRRDVRAAIEEKMDGRMPKQQPAVVGR